MENPTAEKQERIKSFKIHSAIIDGLRAYDIEGDKISLNFKDRIRELCNRYAKLTSRESVSNNKLWEQAAKRNPKKEKDLKREEILEFIEGRLSIELSGSDETELKDLLWEIMDDEDLKQKSRN